MGTFRCSIVVSLNDESRSVTGTGTFILLPKIGCFDDSWKCASDFTFCRPCEQSSVSSNSAHCWAESTSLIPSLTCSSYVRHVIFRGSLKQVAFLKENIGKEGISSSNPMLHISTLQHVNFMHPFNEHQGSISRKLCVVLPEIRQSSGSASKPKGLRARSPNLRVGR